MPAEAPTKPFRCRCGCTTAERIHIKRAGGSIYRTEFVSCTECRAMFHFPGYIAAEKGPPSWPVGYMRPMGVSGQPELSAEELEEIKRAAERAQRHRRRR